MKPPKSIEDLYSNYTMKDLLANIHNPEWHDYFFPKSEIKSEDCYIEENPYTKKYLIFCILKIDTYPTLQRSAFKPDKLQFITLKEAEDYCKSINLKIVSKEEFMKIHNKD